MTIEGAVNTYNVLKENDFKITGESLLSAGTTLLSAAATVAGFKALGSSVRETTALIRSGAACFTAGTLVLTENGQKAIEDIQAGDKVYATDPETGESGYKEVLQTFEKETEVVVHVTYEKDNTDSSEEVENSSADEDADIYSNENCADTTDHVVNLQSTETTTVNTTLNHRFWTEAGWKSAGTLEAGDKLTLADGNTATVTNVAYEDTHATVYNFEVEDFHTYYVGTESVLVHNNGGNCMKTASALAQGGSKGSIKTGGAYKDVPANGGQVHHMPANSVSPYSKNKGPSIRMETYDHMKTASWGRSKDAQAYRAKQKELINKGLFREAQQMDINDIREKFGDKYDNEIQQMLEYTEQLLK